MTKLTAKCFWWLNSNSFLTVVCIVLLGLIVEVNAMYKDDVGVLDFSVATAGHGAVGWAQHHNSIVITTDTPTKGSTTTSCFVAGRQVNDGGLVWRRNVCSVPDEDTQAHSIAIRNTGDEDEDVNVFYTVDNVGIVRAWTIDNGDLLWDTRVPANANDNDNGTAAPRLWVTKAGTSIYVAVSTDDELVFLNAETGSIVDKISASKVTGNEECIEWLSVLPSLSSSSLKLVYSKVQTRDGTIQSGNDLFYGMYEIGSNDKRIKPVHSLGQIKAKHIVANSLQVFPTKINNANSEESHIWAVTALGSVVHATIGGSSSSVDVTSANDWNKAWSIVVAVESTADPLVIRLLGKSPQIDSESTMELFRYENSSSSWKRILSNRPNKKNSSDDSAAAAVFCPDLGLVVTTSNDRSVEVYRQHQDGNILYPLEASGDMFGADGDSVVVVSLLKCSSSGKMTVLFGSERGSTTQFSLESSGDNDKVNVKVDWSAEEGLASLTSAIVLDASHLGFDDLVEETDVISRKLSLASRLNSQWEDITGILSTANGLFNNNAVNFSYRDHLFGFVKVAALLSPKAHRIWGMSTAGKDRGSIRWSLDLPKKAIWHSMVHGTTNAAKATHGIHGDTHSREILVLSVSSTSVDWMCIDGTSGAVNAQNSIKISSPVVQVLPVYGTSAGGCRQASLLLGEDLGLTVVPADKETDTLIKKQLHKTPNGLYTHKVDKVANRVESFRVAHTDKKGGDHNFVAHSVGLTSFAGEQILKVFYPLRHEDVQSMSTILGDNSLLLKYINPHMAVVVTVLSDKEHQTATKVALTLEKEGNGKPKKPVGAGEPGSSTTSQTSQQGPDDLPNMFVNLIDTVSGRVLYRHSHSNVDGGKKISVVISENWVIYTYVNANTRRTEIGVLTLHEGMVHPKGITFFSRPEQSTSFSSFDARESKPVVLSKVYAFPKAVTALGVTSTKQGISRQNILLASSDGALNTMNKMILESRRPVGAAKPEEKKEGLLPYNELIPESPLFSLTYNQTNEPFTSIVSTSTSLESQSLVLGFGGPDIFFTRTSPTKGFDLLPETFNKILVGGTTVGIVIALFVVQRMGKKKILKQGWL